MESGLNDGICVPILFAVIVLNANLPHGGTVAMVVVRTVLLRILAHGATANRWAKAFGERMRPR